jgi:hypothetical protein
MPVAKNTAYSQFAHRPMRMRSVHSRRALATQRLQIAVFDTRSRTTVFPSTYFRSLGNSKSSDLDTRRRWRLRGYRQRSLIHTMATLFGFEGW